MSSSSWTSRLNLLANVLILVALGAFAFRPDGGIRQRTSQWLETRAQRKAVSENWSDISNEGGRISRTEAAPGIVIFSDYQCPFCRETLSVVSFLSDRFPGVGIIQRNLPLEMIHPHAREAALFSICTEDRDDFEEIHEAIYGHLADREAPDWRLLAHDLGIPWDSLDQCVGGPDARARLARDIQVAETLEVTGTPAFAVRNWGVHQGTTDLQQAMSWARETIE